MRLILTRSGGIVTGLQKKTELDTASLSEADSAPIQRLVEAANLKPGHTELPQDPQARDALGYQLEVQHDNGTLSSIGFDHDSASPEIRALVNAVHTHGHSIS